MKCFQIFFSIFFLIGISNHRIDSKSFALFFDLPHTLVNINDLSFFRDTVGIYSGTAYTLSGGNLFKAEESIFSLLDSLGLQNNSATDQVISDKGRILPFILCQFLSDAITAEKAIQQTKIALHEQCKSKDIPVFTAIIEGLFDPKLIAKHTYIISKSISFVEKCSDLVGKHNLHILANWHQRSMVYLYHMDHMKPLMENFPIHNIFVSGTIKSLLPHKQSFEKPLRQKNIFAQDSIFISGMQHHIDAAKKYGFFTVKIENNDYQKAFNEIQKIVGRH